MEEHNEDCRLIVMEYLFHYCYKNTAKALLKQMGNLNSCSEQLQTNDTNTNAQTNSCVNLKSQTFSPYEWSSVDARKDIYDAIKQGGIGKAFALIEQHFPALIRTYNTINRMEVYDQTNLPKSHYTLYKLRCQQFIEALRASGEAEAIQFGKYYLRPYHKFYPELTNSVTPLIAYENLENENVKDLLSQERRDSIADEVNEMILESQQFSPTTALEKIWRQKTVVKVELDSQIRKEILIREKEIENLEKIPM